MMNPKTTQVSPYQFLPRPYSYLAGLGIIFWALLFSGCVAQKADLARVQKDLEDQITRINKEKRDLEGIISKNREDAESLQAQQNAAMKDLFRARAEIRQELKALREADLTTLTGDIEEIDFRLKKIQQDLDEQGTTLATHDTSLATHETTITSNQGQVTTLINQIDQDSQTRNQQLSEFQTSLTSFKESMAGLGNQIVQETERADQANAELRSQSDQKIEGLVTTVASIESQQSSLESEIQTQKTNIQDHSKTLDQIRGALEQSGTLVGGQVTTLESSMKELETHVNNLTEKLNTDNQALRTYLEQDVKASINSMTESVADQQRPLLARLDTVQGELQGLETQTQSNTTQVHDLTQSVLALKEKQQFVGGLLGERGDKFMQESGRLNERLNLLESHQTDLTQKMETNTQSTGSHLTEVNASLNSVTQALENTSANLATRLDSQEQKINDLSSTLLAIQQVKGDLEANLNTMQTASQSTNEMREALRQMNARLQDLEVHQSGLVGKLDADGQAMNSHLAEVNTGIQSVATALQQVEGTLRSRIDEQDRKLNQAMTAVQSAQTTTETSQANLTHLNQLTQTINQLRDIVDTIGTKLGGRVDQHESRLGELAKRVNLLSSRGTRKK